MEESSSRKRARLSEEQYAADENELENTPAFVLQPRVLPVRHADADSKLVSPHSPTLARLGLRASGSLSLRESCAFSPVMGVQQGLGVQGRRDEYQQPDIKVLSRIVLALSRSPKNHSFALSSPGPRLSQIQILRYPSQRRSDRAQSSAQRG
jgi:hypothetical protein